MASVDIGNDQPDISYINSMDQTVDFYKSNVVIPIWIIPNYMLSASPIKHN